MHREDGESLRGSQGSREQMAAYSSLLNPSSSMLKCPGRGEIGPGRGSANKN